MAVEVRPSNGSSAPTLGHLRTKVIQGGAYLFLRQFVSLGLGLVGIYVIMRRIGPDHYGAYVAASGIYLYLANFGQLGVEVYLLRQPGSLSEHDYHIASTILLVAGVFLVVLVEAGSSLLSGWVQVDGFERLLRILVLALPFQLVAIAASARLERLLNFRRVATIEIFSQACNYIIAIPMAVKGFGAWSLVAGWLAQQICACLVFHCSAGYLPRLRLDWTVTPGILSYSFGFSLVTWSWELRALVNPLVVGHFLGATAVGQVGMTIRIVESLTFVKAIAWRLSVASLSRIQHERHKLQEAISLGMQLQTLALGPVLLGFSWLGGLLLPQWLGARWAPVIDLFPFIAVSYLTNAEFNMHSSMLAVFQRNYGTTAFHLVHVFLLTAGTAICVQVTGLIGYGWGEMIALAAYYILHDLAVRVVGSFSYRITAVWWAGLVLGLFWRQLGIWSIAMPFIALMWPGSIPLVRSSYRSFRPAS